MSLSVQGAFPPGIESGRLGIKRAVDMQIKAAQEVAEAGVLSMSGDKVSISDEALAVRDGRASALPSIENGLIDARVAKYLPVANAKVVHLSAESADSAMELLGR